MKQLFLLLFAVTAINYDSHAQEIKAWNGKKCAVVITYDDALNEQLNNAVPLLDSLGLKASFYVTAYAPSTQHRLLDWKKLSTTGHELGNHTLFHPCIADKPGREFVPVDYKMNNYTLKRMEDETRMTNVFLEALDGHTKRTFAFTCGDTMVHDSAFINGMHKDFVAARTVRNQMHTIDKVNLYDVDCYMVNNHTGAQMIAWVKQAMESNSLLVILFHGVGGGSGLDVSLPAHRELLQFLKTQEKDIWVAPMLEVAEHIKSYQAIH